MLLGIFSWIGDKISDVVQNIYAGWEMILYYWIRSNCDGMLKEVNESVNEMANNISSAPDTWMGGEIWTFIVQVADNVILPIAGIVFMFVVLWELISMLISSNNLADIDFVSVLIKWLLKVLVAAFFLSNSLVICNCFFGMSAWAVNQIASIVNTTVENEQDTKLIKFIDDRLAELEADSGGGSGEEEGSPPDSSADADETKIALKDIGNLLSVGILTMILSLAINIMGIVINIIVYVRMIKIYMYCTFSPIPMATITNQTLSPMGQNFLKACFAIGMQAVLMLLIVGIYGVLLKSAIDPAAAYNPADTGAAIKVIKESVWKTFSITLVLVYSLFKSEGIVKSIFNAS